MIPISGTLQAAAEAESRAPLVSIDVVQKRLDLQVYYSTVYGVHRLVESSNGFWVASGYYDYYGAAISACKLTTLLSAAWDTGWVAASGSESYPFIHDLYVDGDDCYIFYEHMNSTTPELYMVTSSNGGASWGTPSLVQNLWTAGAHIYGIAISSPTLVWVAFGTPGTMIRLLRFEYTSSWAWTDFSYYISYDTFDFRASDSNFGNWQLYSRPVDAYTEAIIFNSTKGFTAGDQWDGVFVMHVHNAGDGDTDVASVSHVQAALGCLETDLDYKYWLRGLSRDAFDGFYIGGMYEAYNKYASVDGEEEEDEFFLCRTRDGNAFQLIPASMPAFSMYYPDDYAIGGIVTDTDGTLVIAMNNYYNSKILYASPTWLIGYDTGTAIEGDFIESASINRSVREIAKATVMLSNKDGDYAAGADLVTEGNMLRVSAGYKTSSGDETQARFTGEIVTANHTYGPDKTTKLDVYDALYPATLKLGRPHVLIGKNQLNVDFSVTDDDKKMVDHAGVWALSSNRYKQSQLGTDAFALCSYDPDDVYSVMVKMRADSSINDVRMGIVVGYDPNELTSNLCTVVCYNETNSRIEYGYLDSNGDYSYEAYILTGLTWSADTDYWLRVDRRHGLVVAVYYSLNGISWSGSAWTAAYEFSPKTFPGVYCYAPTADGVSVSFSSVVVASMKYPLSGSDVMKYLATTVGIGTDEKPAISDEFSGSAFTDDWEEGPYGSWSISGGSALGIGGASYPAEACVTTFTAEDVIVKSIQLSEPGTGLSLRSICGTDRYQAIIGSGVFKIEKVVGNVATVLYSGTSTIGSSTNDLIEVTFAAIGEWLYLYINGVLVGYVQDDTFAYGYVGIVSDTTSPSTSDHRYFAVDGFYKPIPGVVTLNANDTAIGAMGQIADMMPSGQFFCNEEGRLRWGVFPESADADLDVEGIVITRETDRGLDKLLTSLNIVGNNAYANARVLPWTYRLSRHLWDQSEEKFMASGNDIYASAVDRIFQTMRISEHNAAIRANPALELCDIVILENGVVQLYDTFTEASSVGLTSHTPDIDLNGSGWECSGTPWRVSSTLGVAYSQTNLYEDPTYIDVGISDYIIELDAKSVALWGSSIAEDFYLRFRGNGTNYYTLTLYFENDQISLGGPEGRLDGIDHPGVVPGAWVHVKVVCLGKLIVAFVTAGGHTGILSHSGASDDEDRTYIELDFEQHYPDDGIYVDNLIVYTSDAIGQILSMSETVGQSYEMSLDGLLGGEEYR